MLFNRQRSVPLSTSRLEKATTAIAEVVGIFPDSFSVVLTSDARMRELNRRYRNRDSSTDVLSFPTSRKLMQKPRNGYWGDIVISVETAARQARREPHGLYRELSWLILHGVLHLLGYDHETDRGEMVHRERRLRQRLGWE
jgi:probable rRNA maturation factor